MSLSRYRVYDHEATRAELEEDRMTEEERRKRKKRQEDDDSSSMLTGLAVGMAISQMTDVSSQPSYSAPDPTPSTPDFGGFDGGFSGGGGGGGDFSGGSDSGSF